VQDGTVGQAVDSSPAVVIRDGAGNPLPGVRVSFGVTAGGGSIAATIATTDMNGRATSGTWTLGTTPGENAVEASVGSLMPARFTADAAAGAAASMTLVQGDGQMALVGDTVPIAPTVHLEDAFGNPPQGTVVRFAVTVGGGSVEGANRVVGPEGTAAPLAWVLGESAGENTLTATVDGLPVIAFGAVGERRPASQVSVAAAGTQIVEVGQPVPVLPRVLVSDEFGNGVAGATVLFAVVSGAGSITGEATVTGADGTAAVGSWTLGTEDGTQTLAATTDSVPGDTAFFFVASTPGAPADMAILAGESQDAEFGSTVDIAPTVLVQDQFGNPAAGATITFTVTGGGGSVSSPTVAADGDGVAMVSSWRIGGGPGPHTLRAEAGTAAPVEFTADGIAPISDYDVEIRYVGTLTESQQRAFADARATWRAAIVGDVPEIDLVNDSCNINGVTLNESVDDLLIFAQVEPIDGPGGILGQAGPCLVRGAGLLPIVGAMRFDEADLEALEGAGMLDEVIVHEMGHVLGIGTLWTALGLLTGAGTDDPFFTGSEAIQGFLDVGGASYAGDPVPVENTGQPGTRDVHWRESVFDNELMTGFLDGGVPNPLSRVSLGSLNDFVYVVDLGAAPGYALPPPPLAAARAASATKIELVEAPLPPPVIVP
jgi:hypothetical protein